mgnify:CR=1 FL=1
MADKAAVQRLMTGTAAGDERHLAGLQIAAPDEFVAAAEHKYVRMGAGKAVEAFDQNVVDGVDAVSYTHLRAHETVLDPVCRLLL